MNYYSISMCYFCLILCYTTSVGAFSFSEYEANDRHKKNIRQQTIARQLQTSCATSLKNKKIAVLIGEQHNNEYQSVNYSDYGPHFEEINTRLRQYGLTTYTQKEIIAHIAQAEMAAVLNNDPDAAFSASKRLGARFILRGLISSRSHFNPIVRTNEVFVDLNFTLSSKDGRIVSNSQASGASWAGANTRSTALIIIRENSERIVADLYYDYCKQR